MDTSFSREEVWPLSTYEEMMIILNVVGLIFVILNYKEKPKK
jgi:hypothetical protein